MAACGIAVRVNAAAAALLGGGRRFVYTPQVFIDALRLRGWAAASRVCASSAIRIDDALYAFGKLQRSLAGVAIHAGLLAKRRGGAARSRAHPVNSSRAARAYG